MTAESSATGVPAVWGKTICLAVLATSVAVVYWPGIHGYWGRDDFAVLALIRMVGTPWSFFLHDHYPVPGTEYRPLGFFSMWLGRELLGTGYAMHALVDMTLHGATALLLFALLRKANIPSICALLGAALFALHPAAVGTALWWSARFDLLATLFILLSLWCAFDYREHRKCSMFVCMLASAFAAMLSKETGLVAVAALSLLALRWAWQQPELRAAAGRVLVGSLVIGASYIVLRSVVLDTFSSAMTAKVPLWEAIKNGLLAWPIDMPGYLSFWTRLNGLQQLVSGTAVLCMLLVAVFVATRCRPSRATVERHDDLALCGLSLFLLPALLQAPVAGFALPLGAHVSAVETAMQSRLYYLGIAGLAMLVAAAASWFSNCFGKRAGFALVLPVAILVINFAYSSRIAAQEFALRSAQIAGPAQAAITAIGNLKLPRKNCQVVFLGVKPPSEWDVFVSMDSIVKALYPKLDDVAHCWFHDDYWTSFNLLPAPVDAAAAKPYLPLRVRGKPVPWRRVGEMVIAYVVPPDSLTAEDKAGMIFLRYDGRAFTDVSAAVVSGQIQPRLR